jgi:hypothetical protein
VKKRKGRKKQWAYQNTAFLLLTLVVLFFVADTPYVHNFLDTISTYGYVGTFVAGIFFVSTFTIAPASLVLISLAESQPLLPLALVAGAGGMIGDLIIFRFFKDQIFSELAPLFSRITGKGIWCLACSPYFSWLMPIFGALIIASPFPDEIGVGLMGVSRIKTWQFMILTFGLNTFGVLLIIFLFGA